MEKKLTARDVMMRACAALLCIFLLAIMMRYATKHIAIRWLRIDNEITRLVTTGSAYKDPRIWKSIDWTVEYPFSESTESEKVEKAERENEKLAKTVSSLRQNARKVKERLRTRRRDLEDATGKKFFGYYNTVEGKRFYDRLIGWEPLNERQYSRMGDKIFVGKVELAQTEYIEERAQSVKTLSEFCTHQEKPLLFVLAPFKVGREEERKLYPAGESRANDNADLFVRRLREEGVSVLDLRDAIEMKFGETLPLFLTTDHHWKPETAFWAVGLVVKELEKYPMLDYRYDPYVLTPEAYEIIPWKNDFLGSQGRNVTLANAEPEYLSLFYPKELTDFSISVPQRDVNRRGNFTITYDMWELREGDYYDKYSYEAYGYGNISYVDIVNFDNPEGRHMLMLKDSFGDPMEMFFARTLSRLEVLDLRVFNGSLETFIEKKNPDAVVIVYTASELVNAPIHWDSHTDLFDFR